MSATEVTPLFWFKSRLFVAKRYACTDGDADGCICCPCACYWFDGFSEPLFLYPFMIGALNVGARVQGKRVVYNVLSVDINAKKDE
mgnify:CR=1 FL=1